MFAVITEPPQVGNEKKITSEHIGPLLHLKVGRRVGRRTLGKVFRSLEGRVIFSKTVSKRGFTPYPTEHLKKLLLFKQFSDHCLQAHGRGLTVGLVDRDGELLQTDTVTRILSHAESVIICTLRKDIEELCRGWLLLTGICPEITAEPRYLLDCDCVFSPDLRVATSGVLFGKGGLSVDRTKIDLPREYLPLIGLGVDPVELMCILSLSNTPRNLQYRINSLNCVDF